MTRFLVRHLLAMALSAGAMGCAFAQSVLQVEGAWVRASVAGQSGTGAFMRLTAREPLTLVGVRTPAAGIAEVHEMKMDGDVMRMRPVDSLALPAGQAVELRPGGYHLMLMDLKTPLAPQAQVPLTLVLRDARGQERRVDLQVPVAARAPGASGAQSPSKGHQHQHQH